MNDYGNIEEIMIMLEQSKNMGNVRVPSFFVYDSDYIILENYALEITEYLENNSIIGFKGIVPHFSIRMPYLCNQNEAESFIARLKESISIAKDCYQAFMGIVIVEISKDWSKNSVNTYFGCLPNYIRSSSDVCYIILAQGQGIDEYVTDIKKALVGSTLWIHLQPKRLDTTYCVSLFHNTAKKMGYSVAEGVYKRFPEVLEKSNITNQNLKQEICQILLQISVNKKINNEEMTINENDLELFETRCGYGNRQKIGFSIEERR